jgi:hypothetical protein
MDGLSLSVSDEPDKGGEASNEFTIAVPTLDYDLRFNQ